MFFVVYIIEVRFFVDLCPMKSDWSVSGCGVRSAYLPVAAISALTFCLALGVIVMISYSINTSTSCCDKMKYKVEFAG